MSKERVFLCIGFIIFSISFFLFYSENLGIVDETAYISMAWTFFKGEIYYDQAGIYSAPASLKVDNHIISRYPPGNSLLLLPFITFHWRLAFLRGYLLMVIGVLIIIRILVHFRLPQYFALLFLLHPSLVLYSRTIMSDLPATIFCLLALLFFIKRKFLLAGIIFSLGIFIRYPVLIIPFSFGLILVIKKELSDFIKFSIGSFIGIIPLALYNLVVFKTLSGSFEANLVGISIINLPGMLIQFFISLNILYPLLLLLGLRTKLKERWIFILPSILFLFFFSLQYYIDKGSNFFETIIRGQRYMLPIIPYLLIPYVEVLNRIEIFKKISIIFIIGLFFMCYGINYKHQRFLKQQSYYQNRLYEYVNDAKIIICNKDIYELINPFIEPVEWVPFESGSKLVEIDISEYGRPIYTACLARNEDVKGLFLKSLNKYQFKREIYKEDIPYYFSVWKIE